MYVAETPEGVARIVGSVEGVLVADGVEDILKKIGVVLSSLLWHENEVLRRNCFSVYVLPGTLCVCLESTCDVETNKDH